MDNLYWPWSYRVYEGAEPPVLTKTREREALLFWVSDGARTHDTRNHNPMLYQLNYTHHVFGTANVVNFSGNTKIIA